jgi:hypothetical protein
MIHVDDTLCVNELRISSSHLCGGGTVFANTNQPQQLTLRSITELSVKQMVLVNISAVVIKKLRFVNGHCLCVCNIQV